MLVHVRGIKKIMLDRAEASKTQEDVVADVCSVVNSMREVTDAMSTLMERFKALAREMDKAKVRLTYLKGMEFQLHLNWQEPQPHRSQHQQPALRKGRRNKKRKGKRWRRKARRRKGKGKGERQDGKEGREKEGVVKVVEKDVMDGQSGTRGGGGSKVSVKGKEDTCKCRQDLREDGRVQDTSA